MIEPVIHVPFRAALEAQARIRKDRALPPHLKRRPVVPERSWSTVQRFVQKAMDKIHCLRCGAASRQFNLANEDLRARAWEFVGEHHDCPIPPAADWHIASGDGWEAING